MILAQDLRDAVLQAAIQGKLTQQLASDSSVDELLEKIRIEKENKDKKLLKEFLLEIDEKDIPFDIPDSWRWVRLDDISLEIGDIDHKMPSTVITGVPYISPLDFTKNGIDYSHAKQISREDFERLSQKIKPEKNDIIFPRYGTIGVIRIVETDIDFLASYSCCVIKQVCFMNHLFVYWILKTDWIRKEINKYINKTTQPNVGLKSIKKFIVPLPPLEEQQRIVERVSELMAKIDEFEKIEKQLSAIKTAFPQDMKDALLQAAMQGKLTQQLPSDSSVDDLLETIRKEKEQLIKEKKIKKEKPLKPISENEIPFDIPDSWRWVRLQSIIDVRDGTHDSPKYYETGVPFITSKNLIDGKISFENVKYISNQDADNFNARSKVDKNDILMAMIGSIGKPVLIDFDDIDFAIKNVALLKYIKNSSINMHYILNVLYYSESVMKQQSNGGVQKFVSLAYLRDFLVPLPPIEEQERIVQTLEKMLAACEGL